MQKFILIVFLFLAQSNFAQELYMPRNIKEAYTKGTRSMDGKPGKNYWQNHGKYDIALTVNAETKIISGTETIVYENNSNDTLKNLPIRFVNNLHKPSSPRGGAVSDDFLSNGLTITALKIEDEVYNEDARSWGTVGNVKLKKQFRHIQKSPLISIGIILCLKKVEEKDKLTTRHFLQLIVILA